MTTDPTGPASSAVPTAHDFTVARLTRQRDMAEKTVDTLSATVAALEREKSELADRLAEVTAEAAATKKKDKADG